MHYNSMYAAYNNHELHVNVENFNDRFDISFFSQLGDVVLLSDNYTSFFSKEAKSSSDQILYDTDSILVTYIIYSNNIFRT